MSKLSGNIGVFETEAEQPCLSVKQDSKQLSAMRPLLEKPKRPLSGYNIFFKRERVRLLDVLPERPPDQKPRKSHGKLGFREMATIIGRRWKELDPQTKAYYEELGRQDKLRHSRALAAWRRQQETLAELTRQHDCLGQDLEPFSFIETSVPRKDEMAFSEDISKLVDTLDKDSIDLIIKTFL